MYIICCCFHGKAIKLGTDESMSQKLWKKKRRSINICTYYIHRENEGISQPLNKVRALVVEEQHEEMRV